jgi:amino acid transporter
MRFTFGVFVGAGSGNRNLLFRSAGYAIVAFFVVAIYWFYRRRTKRKDSPPGEGYSHETE